jgi:hypothetical protein
MIFKRFIIVVFKMAMPMAMTMVCKCCNIIYNNDSCDFHNLCDPCFNNFDNNKMMNRFGFDNYNPKFEDSNFWVNCKVCDHTDKGNMMHNFTSTILNKINNNDVVTKN